MPEVIDLIIAGGGGTAITAYAIREWRRSRNGARNCPVLHNTGNGTVTAELRAIHETIKENHGEQMRQFSDVFRGVGESEAAVTNAVHEASTAIQVAIAKIR